MRSELIDHWVEDRRRLTLLVLVLVNSACAVGVVSMTLLYRAAYSEQERSLSEQASLWAYMIEAVARFDAAHSVGDVRGESTAATLSQVRAAYEDYMRSDRTRDLAIAHVQGEEITFLLHETSLGEFAKYVRIPLDSPRAVPMRRALAGESGTIVGQDYRGIEVLAAYEPVPTLNMAVVAKIDLARIRAPFVRAGLWALCAAVAVIGLGAMAMMRLGVPLVERSEASEMRYHALFTGAPIALWEEDFSAVKQFVDELNERGICDIEAHFKSCPAELEACAARVRIIDVNQAAVDLHGARDKGELLRRLSDTFCTESFATFADEVACLASGAREFVCETVVCRLDGARINVSLRLSRGQRGSGDWSSVMVSMEDITKRKKVEEQLMRSNAELQRFNNLAIGREMRMVELKKQINELCAERGAARPYGMESQTG